MDDHDAGDDDNVDFCLFVCICAFQIDDGGIEMKMMMMMLTI